VFERGGTRAANRKLPTLVKVHMWLCPVSLLVQLVMNRDRSPVVLHAFLAVWLVGLIVLYTLVLGRQRWARLVLAFWTIPWGVILLADPVTEYLEGRETT
jgi:hypothetical protein